MKEKRILVDGREFSPTGKTGIGRLLEGLLDALTSSLPQVHILLACDHPHCVPPHLQSRKSLQLAKLKPSFLASEMDLTVLSRKGFDLYISPYAKLPLFGTLCPAVNTVHDVIYLSHPAYKGRLRGGFERLRLTGALKKSQWTWFVSAWSLGQTQRLVGFECTKGKVRHNAIDDHFAADKRSKDTAVVRRYGLEPGYILVIGNGLPHKNLGVLLEISPRLPRPLIFVGVPEGRQRNWKSLHPEARATWIAPVPDEDLPSLIRNAFCLALPSAEEGYGYPPLEAMACGIPAVTSDLPVLAETTGGRGILVDPSDSTKWLEAMRVLENETTYRTLVRKGLEWVKPLRGQEGWRGHLADLEEFLEAAGQPKQRLP